MTSSTKPEVHNKFALPSEEDRATAVGNNLTSIEYLVKFELWFSRYASGQTDKQTERQTET